MDNQSFVTEIPSSLKQLARIVVRMFYTTEDVQIIDMLVRSCCIKEGDMCELLKYDRKMLRSRIATLKNDKFIQTKLKMETGPDGKAQKVNCYFINYRSFANVVKYKLDSIRKKMEAVERDATGRTSFICNNCGANFTDLEADRLFDIASGEFRCTFCFNIVEEDVSSVPKQDTRAMMIKYNNEMDVLFKLLGEAEGLKLSPELLEPDPIDIADILGLGKSKTGTSANTVWSGEATRRKQNDEPQMDIIIGDGEVNKSIPAPKERPVWLTDSTVVDRELLQTSMLLEEEQLKSTEPIKPVLSTNTAVKNTEDIMSVLLQHEKRSTGGSQFNSNNFSIPKQKKREESGTDSDEPDKIGVPDFYNNLSSDAVAMETEEEEEEDDEEEDDDIPFVMVGDRRIAIIEIDDKIISRMTQEEKDRYIQVYQEYYSSMYE